jgi:alanyl-tRNA synthetase
MTARLYYNDSYATDFDARVSRTLKDDNGTGVILDRTLFYPTSGGQQHDTGSINGVRVLNVLEKNETIVHYIEDDLTGDQVQGHIDWKRRFHFMQHHTGQHILSAVLLEEFGAETVSVSFTERHTAVEIAKENITPDEILAAEHSANMWIYKNTPVRILFPTVKELDTIPLRKKPPPKKQIRIITIKGLDYTPCGGTHCSNTGEVGIITIVNCKKIRKNTRLRFFCGFAALADYRNKNAIVKSLAEKLSSNEKAVEEHVTKIINTNISLSKKITDIRHELSSYRARELFQSGDRIGSVLIITFVSDNENISQLQLLAQKLRELGSCVVLLANTGEQPVFVFACSEDAPVTVDTVFERLKNKYSVKGGGGATLVQGGLPDLIDVHDFIQTAKDIVTGYL